MRCKDVLKLLTITRQTLCKYVKNGIIKTKTLPNGQYDYNKNDVYRLMNKNNDRINVIYARVSSTCQKKDLQNQIDVLEKFCMNNSIKISDILPTYGIDDEKFKSSGKRIKRGLYKIKTCVLNADVNGSLNILRKYLKVSSDLIIPIGSRGLVTKPVMINIINQKY